MPWGIQLWPRVQRMCVSAQRGLGFVPYAVSPPTVGMRSRKDNHYYKKRLHSVTVRSRRIPEAPTGWGRGEVIAAARSILQYAHPRSHVIPCRRDALLTGNAPKRILGIPFDGMVLKKDNHYYAKRLHSVTSNIPVNLSCRQSIRPALYAPIYPPHLSSSYPPEVFRLPSHLCPHL